MNGGFVAGLIVGVLLGLLLGPVLRSWLVWREAESLRREERLSDALLERLLEGDSGDAGVRSR